ncbi:hypothetical protein, partial [Listeria monocytogenes]|uniref:hypothetical protein n=1 Tax=Listeria monocytogenes TaxID=1639 RepID=UPI0019585E92
FITSFVMPALVLLLLGDLFYFYYPAMFIKKESNLLIAPIDLQEEIITVPYISLKQNLTLIN